LDETVCRCGFPSETVAGAPKRSRAWAHEGNQRQLPWTGGDMAPANTDTTTLAKIRAAVARPEIRRALISIGFVIVLWEILGRYVIASDLVFAPLSSIFSRAFEMALSGELWEHVSVSGIEFVLGYGTALILGLALGIAVALNETFRQYVDPWMNALYATPMIALAPIFIVLLGIGIYSKITIIFIEAFFPITVNTSLGIRSTDKDLIEASQSFGANRQQIVRTVLMPNAYPFIIAGMRIAVARGLAGVLISEIFGSEAGVGNMIWFSAESYDMPTLFTGAFILAGSSIIMMSSLARLERRIAPWRN
jgi:ABC-type nitrate/sulfonate/bicarbonate transport system permease component